MPDPFGTAALRSAVLDAWRASPTRFREDANTEEDHARGYYCDRVVTELAQNAADAAAAAGEPGHLLLHLTSDSGGAVLLAANTGAPLTADGVRALASMRASAKAGPGSVGRFGVGFAAVRSVSDELSICSRVDGEVRGVTFSLARARAEIDAVAFTEPDLARQVAAREGDLPALRLPFAVNDQGVADGAVAASDVVAASAAATDPHVASAGPCTVPEGFTTAVALRLRDEVADSAVRAQLAAVDELLLLALAALDRITIRIDGEPDRELAIDPERWTVVRATGPIDPALLADRPVEDRGRAEYTVLWALGPARPGVVHAPTATEEPCTLPATLIATFPLDPTRRHVVPGPVTDAVLAEAARCYVDLVRRVARSGADALALVPTGLPAGPIDTALHDAVLEALPETPLIPSAHATGAAAHLLAPRTAHLLDGAVGQDEAAVQSLARSVTDLAWVPPSGRAAARRLGVRSVTLADVVEALPLTDTALLDALAPHAGDPHVREALAALPVRLADGRTVRGARGVVLAPAGSGPLDALSRWGLRLVDPAAAHPLLLRLGAIPGDPAALLAMPELTRVLEDLADDGDDLDEGDLAARDAVLTLVRAAATAGLGHEVRARLGSLPLVSADGDLAPARELTLPGSFAADVLDALAPVADDELDRWGESTLVAAGVRSGLVVQRMLDVVADDGAETDVEPPPEGWADYLDYLAHELGNGAYVGEALALADLDAVADDRWPQVLARAAAEPETRAALLGPLQGALPYAAWWLRDRFGAPFARPGARVPFVPPVPVELAEADLPDDVWVAVGAVADLTELALADWGAVYAATPPVGHAVELGVARELWRALEARAVGAAGGADLPDPPERVVALRGHEALVCAAEDVVVSAEPMWAQVEAVVPAGAAAAAVAEVLDLPLREVADVGWVARGGRAREVPESLVGLVPDLPQQWWEHPAPFPVAPAPDASAGRASEPRRAEVETTLVTWWVDPDGAVHAVGPRDLAAALAQRVGSWPARALLAAALTDPDAVARLRAEAAWD